MAEGEDHPEMSEERPQTAHQDRRKIPGGFGTDDYDDLSPNKAEFGDSIFDNAHAHAVNNRVPSFDHANLPSLPPPTDSSFLYVQENEELRSEGHMDALDEKAMQRHLNDVESSFLPAVSPIGMTGKKGADDTYLFDGARSEKGGLSPLKEVDTPERHKPSSEDSGRTSPPTPPNAYRTPFPERVGHESEGDTMDAGNTTSSLETMSSSPMAAAAARTVSRAISMASIGGYETAEDNGGGAEDISEAEGDLEATPRKRRDRSSDDRSTLRQHLSNHSLNNAFSLDAGSTPGISLLKRHSSGKRPKFLRSRHASQRSSTSSFITNPESQDGSDVTLGADYALQSGGAVPAGGFSRNSSIMLSRSISLGSMASGIEDFNGGAEGGREGTLATLTEEEQNRERKAIEDQSPPATPRAASKSLAAPTDTIIARHVRNVQVPESLAKEYRNKSGVSSPSKRSGFAVSTLGRNGKNLTLKEQSSTIERLSKENFDLKLKVMFLSDRLDKLSEEGVKEMISENVELKTGLAVMQRDNKALKRKVKELEKQLRDDEVRPGTAGTSGSIASPKWFDQEGAQEREEELVYLRERVEEYVTEIERLRNDSLQRESEKRNLAEHVRSMGERRGQNVEAREEMDVWKDLLEQETARREQGDEENKRLREEILRLRTDTSSSSGVPGLNHTTNIYNITKKRQVSPSRPRSGLSERFDDRNGTFSSASTLVDELKKESEQLRHENAELRREVGAQTSMLTSRNREKERLYQEIEDLKLGHRRGGSVAGDSILERSASRAHERPQSRTSGATRQTSMTDNEREDFENQHAELRDRINSLKIQNQDLQRELESCMEDFETAVEQKKEAEILATDLQEALEVAENDLLTMQADRDEALQGQEEAEIMFESLRKEAQEELDGFAAEAEEDKTDIERLQGELADTTENFNALQNEMREMSEGVVRLEDDQENSLRRIHDLERDLEEANRELEQMEKNLVETNEKINRLLVQQESSQSEISFLREEQDGDKIKIGDLEAVVRNTEQSLREEKDRTKELEKRLAGERHQREILAGREKQEVQQFVNKLNREASDAKDENRRLTKALNEKSTENVRLIERLDALEKRLKEAIGDVARTKSNLAQSVTELEIQLEGRRRELNTAKAALHEKDSELENSALACNSIADSLDKERIAHRNLKRQYDTFKETHKHTTQSLSQHEQHIKQLESSRTQVQRKLSKVENSFKEELNERNKLLLALWKRLSNVCGPEWADNHKIINGSALITLETIYSLFPAFSKHITGAVNKIESIASEFKSRVEGIEKALWKDYHTLEANLETRTKRLSRIETLTRSAIPDMTSEGKAEIAHLKEKIRGLKSEVSSLRAANDVRASVYDSNAPSPSVPTGPRNKVTDKTRTSTMTRTTSASAIETFSRGSPSRSGSRAGGSDQNGSQGSMGTMGDKDLMFLHRQKDWEQKLAKEREGRRLDRESAKQLLKDMEEKNRDMAAQLEREKMKGEMGR